VTTPHIGPVEDDGGGQSFPPVPDGIVETEAQAAYRRGEGYRAHVEGTTDDGIPTLIRRSQAQQA